MSDVRPNGGLGPPYEFNLRELHYDQHKSFRAWLRTVTLNKWRDRCRRQAARPVGMLAEPEDLPELHGPDSFAEAEYRQQLVARAIELMQAEFQPATWKAFWELVVQGRPALSPAQAKEVSSTAELPPQAALMQRW